MTAKAPPISERPRCRACGRRLRPNYDTGWEGEFGKTERVYLKTNSHEEAVHKHGEDVRHDEERDEYYYNKSTRHVASKTWKGTYGAYHDGLFCNLRCAYRWAVAVAQETEKLGKIWRLQGAIEAEKSP